MTQLSPILMHNRNICLEGAIETRKYFSRHSRDHCGAEQQNSGALEQKCKASVGNRTKAVH
jgi:hypothetical protein